MQNFHLYTDTHVLIFPLYVFHMWPYELEPSLDNICLYYMCKQNQIRNIIVISCYCLNAYLWCFIISAADMVCLSVLSTFFQIE